jgi:uncharacterized membrane protein YraQ (UPF0718 family)
LIAKVWGPIVGPLVAVISFVCSVGNIPLAAVLWNGISFGGVIAFIFADLIVLPILNIYHKYYGLRMTAFLVVTFYAAMAGAALIVEALFDSLGLIPQERTARVLEASIAWDYTTWLNILFLAIAAWLVWRFLKTGGPEMLRMMNKPHISCAGCGSPQDPPHRDLQRALCSTPGWRSGGRSFTPPSP